MAESKQMKRIKRMARLAGINPSQKTITNVRLFMEIYRDINHEADHFKAMAKPISATEACPLLFAELLRPDEIDEETIEELECRFIADGWFKDFAEAALNDVKEFGEDGELYYQILNAYYFEDAVTDEDDFIESIGHCRSGFFNKKREATLLYGVYFWGRLLDMWPSAADEMRVIEEKCGRGDELTRGLKMGRNSALNYLLTDEDEDDSEEIDE